MQQKEIAVIVAYWIVAGVVALAFLAAGSMKVARSKEAIAGSGLAWVEDFSSGQVKLIGAAEVLGAIGLILPPLLRIAPVLSPIAAAALAVLMIGAIAVHVRRKESAVPSIVLVVLAIAVAVLGAVAVV